VFIVKVNVTRIIGTVIFPLWCKTGKVEYEQLFSCASKCREWRNMVWQIHTTKTILNLNWWSRWLWKCRYNNIKNRRNMSF